MGRAIPAPDAAARTPASVLPHSMDFLPARSCERILAPGIRGFGRYGSLFET
jgi:hypothetical protein